MAKPKPSNRAAAERKVRKKVADFERSFPVPKTKPVKPKGRAPGTSMFHDGKVDTSKIDDERDYSSAVVARRKRLGLRIYRDQQFGDRSRKRPKE